MRGLLGTLGADTDYPVISITSPASGAVLGCTVTCQASASDHHGIASVEWFLDGSAASGLLSTAPYTLSFDSVPFTDAAHTLLARAKDPVGHTTDTSIGVTFNNNPGSSIVGGAYTRSAGRSSYPNTGSFAAPNYIDTPGWTWPSNPHPGYYKMQARLQMSDFEDVNGIVGNHYYALALAGAEIFAINDNANGYRDSGWFDIADGYGGAAVTFHDWCISGVGGTAYAEIQELDIQYVRL